MHRATSSVDCLRLASFFSTSNGLYAGRLPLVLSFVKLSSKIGTQLDKLTRLASHCLCRIQSPLFSFSLRFVRFNDTLHSHFAADVLPSSSFSFSSLFADRCDDVIFRSNVFSLNSRIPPDGRPRNRFTLSSIVASTQ